MTQLPPVGRARTAILISGRGSNLRALLAAADHPDYPATIALVLSNRAEAPGLTAAAQAGVATAIVPHRAYGGDRPAHEAAIQAILEREAIEIVCLAGYMRLLTPLLVERWAGRMLNIHPSLLPAFPGLDTHRRALAAGVKVHGCTIHLVTTAVDDGPILAQAAVPVLPDDTEAALAARVLAQEHVMYPLALRLFATGRAGPRLPPDGAVLRNPLPEPTNRP
ncbi:MAG: phosphoribosylglycinamide formyltransferase [Acidisphaera sp.]|nr:phosphoribosylglycinamide formyltransferase [Acidisphaera sp.]